MNAPPRSPKVDAQPVVKTSLKDGTSVKFSGGDEIPPGDFGRPIPLIAGALGVPQDVFRQAFSGVTPARGGGGPTGEQARANKAALMKVLAPHGVSNDRLDAVSNYYRFNPGRGETWPRTPAAATVVVKDGKITGFKITSAGSGYSVPPKVTLPGHEDLSIEATIEFGKDLKTNGRVKSLKIAENVAN